MSNISELMDKLVSKDMGIKVEGNSVFIYKNRRPMDELILTVNNSETNDMDVRINGQFKLNEFKWMLGLIDELRFMFKSPVKESKDVEKASRKSEKKTSTLQDKLEIEDEKGGMDYDPDIKRINDHKQWTRSDDEFLKNNYHKKSVGVMARRLGRTRSSIINRMSKLNLKRNGKVDNGLSRSGKNWNSEEIEFLKDNYSNVLLEELSKVLKRTEDSIKAKAYELGISQFTSKRWTDKEIQFLKDNYGSMTAVELGRALGRTERAISQKLSIEGIYKNTRK